MIFITGDTHGTTDSKKLLNKDNFQDYKSLTKKDYVIVLGDFGYYWNGSKNEILARKELDKKKYQVLWIDGNHENFEMISKLPISEWHGGKVQIDWDYGFIHLMRGQVYTIDGLKFFTMGGAYSVDKAYRSNRISWWEEELPNFKEWEEAITNLDKHDWEVDYVLTHTCPDKCLYMMYGSPFDYNRKLEKVFDTIDEKLKYKKWLFGHHHVDNEYQDKYVAMYNKIYLLGGK